MWRKFKIWLYHMTPRIYNCRDVIYIRWRDYEYIIKKHDSYRY